MSSEAAAIVRHSSDPTREELLRQAEAGDRTALAGLIEALRPRLARLVALRLNPRLRRRFDPADIVQDAILDVARRRDAFLRDRPMPFDRWVVFLVRQKLDEIHRRHLGSARRDVRREEVQKPGPEDGSALDLAERLADSVTGPGDAAARAEARDRLEAALRTLDAVDREVLILRHFERLTHAEAAAELGLTEAAASKRHVRALERLATILRDLGLSR